MVLGDVTDPWLMGEYDFRIPLTVDSTNIDDDLDDFPVLVYLSGLSWGNVQDDLDDLYFTDLANTTLAYEIDDYSVNSYAFIWVKVDLTTGSDVLFYLYYGNLDATSQENKAGVWDANFKAVHHLTDETPTTVLDSTSNNNDGVKVDTNEPLEITGFIGSGQQFDKTDFDYIDCGNDASIRITPNQTLSFWEYTTNTDMQVVIQKKYSDNVDSYGWSAYNAVSGVRLYLRGHATTSIYSPYTLGSWQFVTCTWESTNGETFINGTSTKTGSLLTIDNTYMGNLKFGGQTSLPFGGSLDEIRISDIVRSDAWIKAEYYSGINGLISFGDVENRPLLASELEDLFGVLFVLIILFFVIALGVAVSYKR